jgi:hypothetical protein
MIQENDSLHYNFSPISSQASDLSINIELIAALIEVDDDSIWNMINNSSDSDIGSE